MSATKCVRGVLVACGIMACAVAPAYAFDGQGLTDKYAGFLVATQTTGTGWGNHKVIVNEPGIVVGSELDALYMSLDDEDLWIGITGNLPNRFGNSESIVILLDFDGGTPANPNLLSTINLPGYGGGWNVIQHLDSTILEQNFDPEWVVVVNRFAESTYANAWYLPYNEESPWDSNLISLNPYNQPLCHNETNDFDCYMSVWMDTTNTGGVTGAGAEPPVPPDGVGPGTQGELAAQAVKGLRLRLSRSWFLIGQDPIKVMVILASPGDNGGVPATYVSNQILPPLSTTDDPAAPGCVTPPWPVNFDENYQNPPETGTYGFAGRQVADGGGAGFIPAAGTPTGFDGSNIPNQWPSGSLVTTQQIHTCYGDAVEGFLNYTIEGSELDQLFVRADDQYLWIAVTGNLEGNGNKVSLWIDADPTQGENTLDANSPAPPNATMIYGWQGRTFDDGFAPEHAYILNNWQGTLYVDAFHLLLPDADVHVWQGYSPVNGTSDNWVDGTNPNGNRFVLNHTNNAGVVSCTDPASPGEAETATSGLEAKISLTELGVPAGQCRNIKVWVVLGGGDSVYLSNQALPSFAQEPPAGEFCGNVGSYASGTTPFDFGETLTVNRGHSAFYGDQFVGTNLRRLGDVAQDVDCCINADDLAKFVQVLLGLETGAKAVYFSDMNQDGKADGADIQPFVARLIAEGACP